MCDVENSRLHEVVKGLNCSGTAKNFIQYLGARVKLTIVTFVETSGV